MFSKFSEDAQKVLMNSKKEMQELKHPYVGSEHLFLSLLKLNKDFSKKLKELGVTYTQFRNRLVEMVGIGGSSNNWFLYTPLLKRIIETALLISKESSSGEVTSEHLIYALCEEGEGVAIRILNKFGVDIYDIQNYYSYILTNKKKGTKKKLLVEELGVDLTRKASKGELDPVVGRGKEIKRMMEILCRRGKNNPLLVGEAGVGKTALVEELARLIIKNQVPDKLKNKRIISVSMASLVSGTKYRGEFEERVTRMLKELEDTNDIYLFIDEIHTIMGAGGAEGAIDAANIFKPALSRGKIKLIGATTIDEYKKTIEKDRAMERRFQPVFIYEPTDDETLDILKALRPVYESYHGVSITDNLLEEIIKLSNKYINDRKQPDKAIDVLDEVCSKVSLENNSNPNKLDSYKEKLVKIKEDKNNYLIKQDFLNASRIKSLEKEITSKINNLELRKKHKTLKSIKLGDIATVISLKTNIPVYEVSGVNNKYIKDLNIKLHASIKGQDNAIAELIKITKKIKLGYKDNNKPVSMLFVGGTGVGKTKLAITYCDYVFGKNKVIRLDGSEYKEPTSINKILGSNAGYVGYDDNKNVLELIRNNPHCLILFDEVEKAHPSVLNLFLQIFDEGKITDNKGNVIYFDNSIIVMTSNIGFNKEDIGFTSSDNKNDSKLKEFLSIELLNRINKVVYFRKLDKDNITEIVRNKLKLVKKRFRNLSINIHINEKVIDNIIKESRYLEYGARKIDQIIDDYIDNYIIDEILTGKKEIYVNN